MITCITTVTFECIAHNNRSVRNSKNITFTYVYKLFIKLKMGRGKHCTEEERNAINSLRKQGKTYKQIKEILSCSNQMITNAIRYKMKAETRGAKRKTSSVDDQRMVGFLASDPSASSNTIQKELKVQISAVTIRRRLKNLVYKLTTDKQYSLLNHEMGRYSGENYKGTGKSALKWNVLTEKLNAMGPPYRTVTQWKKIWTDYQRFHSRKAFTNQPKYAKIMRKGPSVSSAEEGENNAQSDHKSSTTSKSKVADYLHSESKEYEQNYESMHSTLSNDFADEYSYPDRHSQQQQQQQTTHETLIPDDIPYDTPNYSPVDEDEEEISQIQGTSHAHIINADKLRSPSLLQPANIRLIDQTLYTLQNQVEQQTKLLEHISQISTTMATLMERQVNATEQQTEAIRRQASATLHHTLVMNNFVDMIREKMPKVNSKTNLPNGS